MLKSFIFIDICIHADRNIRVYVYVSVHIQTEVSAAVNRVLQFICTATRCSHITLQNLKFWPQGYRNILEYLRLQNSYNINSIPSWVPGKKNVLWAEFSIFLLNNFVPKHSVASVDGGLRNQSRVRLAYFRGCCHRSRLELTILNYIVFCFLHNRASRNEALCSQVIP